MVRHGEGPEHPPSPRCDGCHEGEVDRLRVANTALAAALEDIAGMREVADGAWVASAECSNMGTRCCWEYLGKPDGGPEEWCPTCVAEIAWCAWKLGVLG